MTTWFFSCLKWTWFRKTQISSTHKYKVLQFELLENSWSNLWENHKVGMSDDYTLTMGSSVLSQVKSLHSPYINELGFKWVSEWAFIFKMWFFFKMCFHFQNVKGFVGSSMLSQVKSLHSPYINEHGFKMGFGMSFHFQNVFFFEMCFHFQNVKGFMSCCFFTFSEKHNCEQKFVNKNLYSHFK